jgi:hypothetical protein
MLASKLGIGSTYVEDVSLLFFGICVLFVSTVEMSVGLSLSSAFSSEGRA